MPRHHPPRELLMDYAAGSLPDATATLVATHLALCPDCRAEVAALEAVGGELLDRIDPMPMGSMTVAAVMARLETAELPPAPPSASPTGDILLPEPLRRRLSVPLSDAAWRPLGRQLAEIQVAGGGDGVSARLMRIAAGAEMPRHTHGGHEFTLVLAGGFSDARGHYRRGDIAIADHELVHAPLADDDETCICFAVVDGGLKLTGPIGRVVNLFWRF